MRTRQTVSKSVTTLDIRRRRCWARRTSWGSAADWVRERGTVIGTPKKQGRNALPQTARRSLGSSFQKPMLHAAFAMGFCTHGGAASRCRGKLPRRSIHARGFGADASQHHCSRLISPSTLDAGRLWVPLDETEPAPWSFCCCRADNSTVASVNQSQFMLYITKLRAQCCAPERCRRSRSQNSRGARNLTGQVGRQSQQMPPSAKRSLHDSLTNPQFINHRW
jgi:hypothetical protein